MLKLKICIDCHGKKAKGAERCWKCYVSFSQKPENNPNYRGGKPKCNICKKDLPYYDKRSKVHRNCRSKYRRENPKRNPVINTEGYRLIWMPEHPSSRKDGYIFEHRVIMEKKIGRHLLSNEIAHHMNHIRNDNRPENLMLINKKEHDNLHINIKKGRKI